MWIRACRTVLTLLAVLAAAETGGASELERYGFAKRRVGLLSGYGWGFGALGSEGLSQADVRVVPIIATWSLGSEPLAMERGWGGNFEIQVEGQLWLNQQPRDGLGGGAAATLRYDFLRARPVFPFVEAGLGLGGIDFDTDQPDGFIFIVQAGGGAHWRVTRSLAVTLQYRFLHLSNAGTREPNNGINAHMSLVGPTLFLR